MYLLDYSLDNLSMMALVLSIGFVVDDAIVMLENIVRHIELGEDPQQASLKGSGEIGFTIVSMTLSVAAVFIPVLFLGGVLGRLFKEFAVTICVAILISGVVSVTLTPMLCSRFLRAPHARRLKHGWFYNGTEKFFQGMLRVYDRTLQWTLRYHPVMALTFVVVLGSDGLHVHHLPQRRLHSRPGYRPDERHHGRPRRAHRSTRWREYEQKMADVVAKDPNVDALMASVGGTTASNLGGPNYYGQR